MAHNLVCYCPFSLCQTFVPSPWFGLLSLFSLFPLVLKQAVYCVCSAEQPAQKALCICVFVPASLSDRVNPSEALVTSCPPCPLFLSPPPSIGSFCFSGCWYALPPANQRLLASWRANHAGCNPLLTSQDQTAIRNRWVWEFRTACFKIPWCFAADQCLSRDPEGGKTRSNVSVSFQGSRAYCLSLFGSLHG